MTNSNYCDCVVWSQVTISIERIKLDPDFLDFEVARVNILYRHLILPELLGKLYSRSSVVVGAASSSTSDNVSDTWCYCRNADDGTMIRCMGQNCTIRQFHKVCTGLKRVPKHWLCTECRKAGKKSK